MGSEWACMPWNQSSRTFIVGGKQTGRVRRPRLRPRLARRVALRRLEYRVGHAEELTLLLDEIIPK